MTNKKLILLVSLLLLGAGCNPFTPPPQAGVYKTLNGGSDWQSANKLSAGTGSLSGAYISKMAFDPQGSQTVYAGAYGSGLYKSGDAGATWTNILSKIQVYDFAINPQDSKIIYAAGVCVDHGCVVATKDAGASWNEVYHEGAASNAVRAIAINPVSPTQIIIGTAQGSVLKSSDSALSWQLAKNFNNQINRILWQDSIYVLAKDSGLFKSQDLGATFTELTASLKISYGAGQLTYSTNNSSVGQYRQVYADLSATNLIYVTADKGLYKSTDGGQTWAAQILPVQPGASAAHAIAVSKTSSNIIYAGVGGTVYKSLDGGQNWQTQGVVSAGYINYILIDPGLPQVAYAGVYIDASN